MLDSKHKLPLKKVRLQRSGYDLYTKNQSRLQVIPGLFMILLLACLVGGFIWYFDFFGLRSPRNTIAANSSSIPVIISQPTNSSSSTVSQKNITETETVIKITNTDGLVCYFQYSANTPTSISFPASIKSQIGWWSAITSSCGINIQHIAIFRLTNEEKTNSFLSFSNKLQALDDVEPKTYALVFSPDSSADKLNMREHVKKVTLPVFQDRTYFKPSLAFSELRRGDGVFYLDGTCSNTGINTCSLWYKNSTGNISLVTFAVLPNQNGANIQFSQIQPSNTDEVSVEQRNTNGEVIASVVLNSNADKN